MRMIELKTIGNLKTTGVIKELAQSPGERGVLIEEIRLRLRLVDAVEIAEAKNLPSLLLEDADYRLLERLVKSVPFVNVTHGILQIADDILQAPEAPAPVVASIREAS